MDDRSFRKLPKFFHYRSVSSLTGVIASLVVIGECSHSAEAGSFSAAVESIQEKQLRKHVEVLASDTFEGREAGSRGGRAAGVYLVERLKKLGVRPAGVDRSFYQEFGNGYRNVLAMFPGRDPRLKDEVILLCAHYDHVGYGTRQNSLGAIGYIHNGADDNGSGTAGLLEIVEAFAKLERRPSRTILFAFWDAEEKGLLGSRHWIRRPTVPLGHLKLAINIDMIGRMRENRVIVVGSRSAVGWRRIVAEQNGEAKLHLEFPWTLKRNSDHYPFIENGIPAIMLHTGKHEDYHRPSDDSHKVKYKAMQRVGRLVFRLAHRLANEKSLPAYRAASLREDDDDRSRLLSPLPPLPTRFGVSWSSGENKSGPLKIGGVLPGSPAEVAGLKIGDRIESFDDVPINGSAMFHGLVMKAFNPVSVEVLRGKENRRVTLQVKLNGHPRRVGISWGEDPAEPGTVILRRVITGSPAALAGLKNGDRILAVQDHRFKTAEQFREMISQTRNGMKITFERHGQIQTVTLKFSGNARSTASPIRAEKPRRASLTR
ncbi:MAG: hypothetical protein Tsb009_18940 [Planctomycetaceae bacterium]